MKKIVLSLVALGTLTAACGVSDTTTIPSGSDKIPTTTPAVHVAEVKATCDVVLARVVRCV